MSYKITAPNSAYNGTTCGLAFTKGEAETDDEYIALYLKEKGYAVEESEVKPEKSEQKKKGKGQSDEAL